MDINTIGLVCEISVVFELYVDEIGQSRFSYPRLREIILFSGEMVIADTRASLLGCILSKRPSRIRFQSRDDEVEHQVYPECVDICLPGLLPA